MKKTLLMTTLLAWGLIGSAELALAQVAGSTVLGLSVTETTQVAMGWSVKKTLMGQAVYTESGSKIGNVEDLIISPEKNVSYVIVGAGGFIGIGRHDVAIPVSQIQARSGKLVMPGATKEQVKAMPQFAYATEGVRRDQFVARAQAELDRGMARMAELQKKGMAATAEAKAAIDKQVATVQTDVTALEGRISEMNKAGASRWHPFEQEINEATLHLRQSIDAAVG